MCWQHPTEKRDLKSEQISWVEAQEWNSFDVIQTPASVHPSILILRHPHMLWAQDKIQRSPQINRRSFFNIPDEARSGKSSSQQSSRFPGVQGRCLRRTPPHTPPWTGWRPSSPQWTLIPRAVPFEQVPGADADLRDKWGASKATDVRPGN